MSRNSGFDLATLNPHSSLDIELFLSGYDSLLAEFGLENWHHQTTQTIDGPNWKVAYDGYLDYYHFPSLHRNTFGPNMGNQGNFYGCGPHNHIGRPDATLEEFEHLPDDEWPITRLLSGVWNVFPHAEIAQFGDEILGDEDQTSMYAVSKFPRGGSRSVMISQLFSGDTPETSVTNQIFLMESEPDTELLQKESRAQIDFFRYVVEEEDYSAGFGIQKNLGVGAKTHVLYGENEGGSQRFHQWVDAILETSDEDLPKLFQTG